MSNTTKIILTNDVPKLGKAGEMLTVKAGYARNYLFPQGLAYFATPAMERQAQVEITARQKREERKREALTKLAERIAAEPIVVEVKVGDKGQMFGSVTEKQLEEAIESQFALAANQYKLTIPETIKTTGEHKVTLSWSAGIEVTALVQVNPAAATEGKTRKRAKKEK